MKNKIVTIKNSRVERINLNGGRSQPKLILSVETIDKNPAKFEISEAMIKKEDEILCQGLWVNLDKEGKVAKKSTLNQVLKFFDVSTIEELVGRTVGIKPNPEQFFAIYCV